MTAEPPRLEAGARRDFFIAMLVLNFFSPVSAGALSFDPPITGAVGNQASWLAIADLDEDGRPDLLVTTRNETEVSVLLANPNGTWGPRSLYNHGCGDGYIEVGDVDLDGHLDAVVTNPYLSSVSFMRGSGQGTLTFVANIDVGYAPAAIGIADLDGDGWPDLATPNYGTLHCCYSVTTVNGLGNGAFASAPTELPASQDMLDIAVVDFDDDGALDILASSATGRLHFYRGNGDGAFSPPATSVAVGYINDFVVADMDEDGHQDVVAGGWSWSAMLFKGNGDGTLAPQVNWIPARSGGARAVAVADFDGDGHLDVATSVGDSAAIALGNGDGTVDPEVFVPCGGRIYDMAATDMDLDGRSDLVVVYGSTVAVLLNNSTPISVGTGPAAADFDLEGLRPSPATADLRVAFRLSSAAPATLDLLDLSGRRIATREVGSLGAGHHIVTIGHAAALSAGVYWLQLRSENERRVARAVVVH